MLEIRKRCDAFSPYAAQEILDVSESVFAIRRKGEKKSVTVLVNVSSSVVEIIENGIWGKDLINGRKFNSLFTMEPYECLWIEEE